MLAIVGLRADLKVWVYGLGAIGGFYGSQLLRAGAEVSFILRPERTASFGNLGLSILDTSRKTLWQGKPNVYSSDKLSGLNPPELVLIATKATANTQVSKNLAEADLPQSTQFVCLQNGLCPEIPLQRAFGLERVWRAVMNISVHALSAHELEFVGEDSFYVSDKPPLAKALVDLLAKAGSPASTVSDLDFKIWEKLLWNIPFNAITALSRGKTGNIYRSPRALALTSALMLEVWQLAQMAGINLPKEAIEEQLALTDALGTISTSTREDILAGRALELQPLWGDLADLSRRLGLPTPHLDTIYALLELSDLRSEA